MTTLVELNEKEMDEREAKIMWAVFQWAFKNKISVEMKCVYDCGYDGHTYPVLRFSRDNKHIEQAFYPLIDLGPKMDVLWKNIALNLCVEPLVLL